VRVFASRYGNRVRDPLPTKRARLIKFLLAFAIGHPASILRILDAVYTTVRFDLNAVEEDHVVNFTAKFYEAMRFMKAPGLSAIQTDDDAINAQANAVRAQQWAGHPALFKVISKFVEFLDLVAEAFIRTTKTLAFRFDGTVKEGDRQTTRDAWSNSKSPHPLILVTAGAGGVGMNLQAGNHVVRCERWWTESEEMQADARCHRKNQAKQVRVWTMEGKTSPIDDGIKQTRDCKAAAKAVNVQGKRLLRSASLNCLL
jgi:SNF2 family DNA or RNA helicase